MSVLKSYITASHTPPVAAAAGEVRHTVDTGGTRTGGTHQGGVVYDIGIESDGGSTSINKDLYREVRRYLGLL